MQQPQQPNQPLPGGGQLQPQQQMPGMTGQPVMPMQGMMSSPMMPMQGMPMMGMGMPNMPMYNPMQMQQMTPQMMQMQMQMMQMQMQHMQQQYMRQQQTGQQQPMMPMMMQQQQPMVQQSPQSSPSPSPQSSMGFAGPMTPMGPMNPMQMVGMPHLGAMMPGMAPMQQGLPPLQPDSLPPMPMPTPSPSSQSSSSTSSLPSPSAAPPVPEHDAFAALDAERASSPSMRMPELPGAPLKFKSVSPTPSVPVGAPHSKAAAPAGGDDEFGDFAAATPSPTPAVPQQHQLHQPQHAPQMASQRGQQHFVSGMQQMPPQMQMQQQTPNMAMRMSGAPSPMPVMSMQQPQPQPGQFNPQMAQLAMQGQFMPQQQPITPQVMMMQNPQAFMHMQQHYQQHQLQQAQQFAGGMPMQQHSQPNLTVQPPMIAPAPALMSPSNDDFGDFSAVPAASTVPAALKATPASELSFDNDDDGDFGDFSSAQPVAAAQPPLQSQSPAADEDDFGDFTSVNQPAQPLQPASAPLPTKPTVDSLLSTAFSKAFDHSKANAPLIDAPPPVAMASLTPQPVRVPIVPHHKGRDLPQDLDDLLTSIMPEAKVQDAPLPALPLMPGQVRVDDDDFGDFSNSTNTQSQSATARVSVSVQDAGDDDDDFADFSSAPPPTAQTAATHEPRFTAPPAHPITDIPNKDSLAKKKEKENRKANNEKSSKTSSVDTTSVSSVTESEAIVNAIKQAKKSKTGGASFSLKAGIVAHSNAFALPPPPTVEEPEKISVALSTPVMASGFQTSPTSIMNAAEEDDFDADFDAPPAATPFGVGGVTVGKQSSTQQQSQAFDEEEEDEPMTRSQPTLTVEASPTSTNTVISKPSPPQPSLDFFDDLLGGVTSTTPVPALPDLFVPTTSASTNSMSVSPAPVLAMSDENEEEDFGDFDGTEANVQSQTTGTSARANAAVSKPATATPFDVIKPSPSGDFAGFDDEEDDFADFEAAPQVATDASEAPALTVCTGSPSSSPSPTTASSLSPLSHSYSQSSIVSPRSLSSSLPSLSDISSFPRVSIQIPPLSVTEVPQSPEQSLTFLTQQERFADLQAMQAYLSSTQSLPALQSQYKEAIAQSMDDAEMLPKAMAIQSQIKKLKALAPPPQWNTVSVGNDSDGLTYQQIVTVLTAINIELLTLFIGRYPQSFTDTMTSKSTSDAIAVKRSANNQLKSLIGLLPYQFAHHTGAMIVCLSFIEKQMITGEIFVGQISGMDGDSNTKASLKILQSLQLSSSFLTGLATLRTISIRIKTSVYQYGIDSEKLTKLLTSIDGLWAKMTQSMESSSLWKTHRSVKVKGEKDSKMVGLPTVDVQAIAHASMINIGQSMVDVCELCLGRCDSGSGIEGVVTDGANRWHGYCANVREKLNGQR